MSGSVKIIRWVAVSMVIIAVAYIGGTQLGAFLAEREIAAAEQGQS